MEKKESKTASTANTKTTRKRRTPKGLGDTIEQITTATGIKAAVDWFSEQTGIDCGCDARKEKLNKLLQYSRVECLTKDEYDWLNNYYAAQKPSLSTTQQKKIAEIHARIFNHKLFLPCTCSPKRWSQMIEELRKVFLEYTEQQ
jgi:hypothetical protein